MKQEPRKHAAARIQPLSLCGLCCAALRGGEKSVGICCPESRAAVLPWTVSAGRTRTNVPSTCQLLFSEQNVSSNTGRLPSRRAASAHLLSISHRCSRAPAGARSRRQGSDPGPKRKDDNSGKRPPHSWLNEYSLKNCLLQPCSPLFSTFKGGCTSRQRRGLTCFAVMGNVPRRD